MKKKKDANLYVKILAGAVIVVLAVLALMNYKPLPRNDQPQTSQPVLSEGGYQQAMLTYTSKGYEMVPSTLKASVPVHVTVDLESVTGCLRSVTIPQLGVKKTVSEGDNVFEFTPSVPGEYQIICAMRMGKGMFKVE